MIEHINGNLLEADAEALVNTVNDKVSDSGEPGRTISRSAFARRHSLDRLVRCYCSRSLARIHSGSRRRSITAQMTAVSPSMV